MSLRIANADWICCESLLNQYDPLVNDS